VTPDAIAAAAAELLDMRATHRIEVDLPDGMRPETLDDSYAIQRQVVAGLLPQGAARIGYKAACTSEIAQRALRIDGPLFGQLLSHTSHASGARLDASDFVHRVIEAEFAFRIGSDVARRVGGHTPDSVAPFIDAVIPAIEIVDYRYQAWTIGALQVAADNAIHGAWVAGGPVTKWRHLDLVASRVSVFVNGRQVTSGSGAAVLGDPLAVMAWLAGELPRFGFGLAAGDVVTTGVTTGVFEAAPGDVVEAHFDGVGSVSVLFD
jgi:2-keto-4-pentenoate hydratase